MEIGKFNQMKAYLLKPKRLFTKKQDTIGGGNFTGQDLGSRTGFAGIQQVKNVTKMQKAFPDADVKLGDYYFEYRNPDGKGKLKKGPFKTKKAAQKAYDLRQEEARKLKGTGRPKKVAEQTQAINRFITNFYNQNINKYGIRDYDKFETALLDAYKKADIPDVGGNRGLYLRNMPHVGTREYSNFPLTLFGTEATNPTGKNPEKDFKNFFKKSFFAGKLQNNPELVQNIKRYLDYYNIDKKYRGLETDVDRGALKKQYADVLDPNVQSDILYLLESDEVGTGKLRGGIIKQFLPEEHAAYIKKKDASGLLYKEVMNKVEQSLSKEDLAKALNGETSIKKFMDKQTALLNEIFDTSELKKAGYSELIFNADHLEGMAEIVRMNNPEDKIRALKNLIGMTSQRNFELGMKGFSAKRKNIMTDITNKIQKGIDIKDDVAELNKITKIAYPEFEGDLYRYNPATKSVIPTENFRVEYTPEKAFGQYFNELARNPTGKFKGTEALIKAGAGSPELVKFIQDIEGGNFKNFNKVVSQYQKGKIDFGKELDYYCKVAGKRITVATGMVPGATCSSADIERGMRADAKTPEGRERLTKVAKNFGKIFGKIVAPIDIGIEGAFALPHLLRGDAEGAIAATTAGLFGAGKGAMEQVGERFGTDSPEYALYGAENAIQQKMTAIAGLDKLLMQNRQLGIIPEESGEFKKGIGRQPQEDALRKQFAEQFVTLSKLDKGATEDFAQYYPLTADLTQRNKAIQNVRGLSDEIQSSGLFKNIKGPSDTKTIEGFLETAGGRSKFPILPRFDLPALRAQATDYTGMDYLDRVSDMPTDIAAQVPAFEKSQIGQGVKNYAMEFGPKAAKEFFDAQGIDTQPYLEGMAPLLYKAKGGRITFASGGRMSYAEGPEDPSKRKFLKNVGIGGGIAGGFMTGLLNLVDLFKGGKKGVVATKAAESEAEKIFLDLVDVVKNKGILKRLDDRFETKVGELYEYKGVKVLEDGENIEVRFETDKGAPAVVEYRKPGYEVDPDAQTSVQTPGEFIYEAQEIGKYGPDGDVDIDFVEEIVDPIENIKSMAKEKK